MARVALPQSKIRARRKKRRIRIAIVAASAAVLLIGVVVGVSWMPMVRVSEIQIEGVRGTSARNLEQFVKTQLEGRVLGVFPKNSVFLYPRHEILAQVQGKFPALHSVGIRAHVPSSFQTLIVSAEERQSYALWCGVETEESCAFMDGSGMVYALAPEFSDPIYVRYLGPVESSGEGNTFPKQFLTPEQFGSLSALVLALGKEVGPIDKVHVAADNSARLSFVNGFDLLFSVEDDGGDIFERFTLARDAEPLKGRPLSDFLYLDLRFGDKLYYKLKAE